MHLFTVSNGSTGPHDPQQQKTLPHPFAPTYSISSTCTVIHCATSIYQYRCRSRGAGMVLQWLVFTTFPDVFLFLELPSFFGIYTSLRKVKQYLQHNFSQSNF